RFPSTSPFLPIILGPRLTLHELDDRGVAARDHLHRRRETKSTAGYPLFRVNRSRLPTRSSASIRTSSISPQATGSTSSFISAPDSFSPVPSRMLSSQRQSRCAPRHLELGD